DRPQTMHDPEHRVTIRDAAGEHAQRTDVVQLAEADLLALHLPPDGIDVLGAAVDAGFDAMRGQRLAQLRNAARDPRLAVGAPLVQQLRDPAIDVRLQVAEGQVFEFPFPLAYAQPVRERRMDVARQ